MILGITGSIGSGKTTAAKIFGKYHFNSIDADEIGHKLIKNNKELKNKLVEILGNEIIDINKNINRKKLGDIVFNNYNKLKKLNLIMHPLIINEIKNQIKQIQKKCGNKTKIMIDAPLLLETKTKDLIDKIIVVKCDKEDIMRRLNQKFSQEKIERILNAQMPLEEKLEYADFVIENSKDLEYLEKQVKGIIQKLNKK